MTVQKARRGFDPHAAARAVELAGSPLASFKSRWIAFVIDFIAIVILYAPLEIARQYLWLKFKGAKEIDVHVYVDYHNPGSLIAIVLYFGLWVYFTNGQTLGKRLMKIRIVSLMHKRITLFQAFERALGYGASALEGGFGFLQFFINHNRCCVHDRIAETIVVRDDAVEDE